MTVLTCALGPDAAGTLLSARLGAAGFRADLAVFEMSVYYAHLLRRPGRSGAILPGARVLLDRHAGANAGAAALLPKPACRVLPGHFGAEAHWKLLLIDGSVAVGTGNLLHRDAPRDSHGAVPPDAVDAGPGTREWWVIVDGAARLSRAAAAAFDARWAIAGPPPDGWRGGGRPDIPPVGVPLPLIAPLSVDLDEAALDLVVGGSNALALLTALLGSARRRVAVTVPYVHAAVPAVAGLLDLLAGARARGVDVRLLLGADRGSAALDRVSARGIPLRTMDPARCTTGHAKGVVVDDTAVVMSSNWSAAGLGGNLEAALRIEDSRAAGYFLGAFEHDWQTATP